MAANHRPPRHRGYSGTPDLEQGGSPFLVRGPETVDGRSTSRGHCAIRPGCSPRRLLSRDFCNLTLDRIGLVSRQDPTSASHRAWMGSMHWNRNGRDRHGPRKNPAAKRRGQGAANFSTMVSHMQLKAAAVNCSAAQCSMRLDGQRLRDSSDQEWPHDLASTAASEYRDLFCIRHALMMDGNRMLGWMDGCTAYWTRHQSQFCLRHGSCSDRL